MATSAPVNARERRTSRRSRYGCRNCKLRKLKCDESKPQCRRCQSFGVLCNFMSNTPELQPVAADPVGAMVFRRKEEIPPLLTSPVWTSDASITYQLNAKCQDFVTRYLGRSLITPDNHLMMQVNRELLKLAFAYPFLMHASLAVALTYDRHINTTSGYRPTLEECYHWSQSTVLLNRRLREPIKAKDKDPIWGTAAFLAILTFSSPNACTPEDSWPLKSSGASDLNWLRMSSSKMSLWHIVNPLRPDSLFSIMAPAYAYMQSPLPETCIDGIPRAIAAVCSLEESSTAKSNPYFYTAHAISQALNLPDNELTTGQVQLFTRSINDSFRDLLLERDPVALLLLYLWYRKVSRNIWWIELRARVECPSICLYLQIYHKENTALQTFLPGGVLADRWN